MTSRSAPTEPEQPPTPSPEESHKAILYKDMSNRSEIPFTVWKASTDPKLWNATIDVIQPSEAIQLTTYFVWSFIEAIWFKLRDKSLHNVFREEFAGWNMYQFDAINRSFRKRMIQLLEKEGEIPAETMSGKLVQVLDPIPPPIITPQLSDLGNRLSYKPYR